VLGDVGGHGSNRSIRQQLASLYAISIEIAMLHDVAVVLDRALGYCLELTDSAFGFVGLVDSTRTMMDVAAIRGFEPTDPGFHERYRLIPLRPTLFGVVINEGRANISNDVLHDPNRVGQPPGHPPVRTYLGVPLRVGEDIIGMIGVANRQAGYSDDHARLLSTFANQVAVAIGNARLYESLRQTIEKLAVQDHELVEIERERVLRQERERIARDIHDRIEQAIFTIGLQVNAELDRGDLPPETASRLVEIRRVAARTAAATKEVIFAMSDPSQQGIELQETLRRLVRDMDRSGVVAADLVVSGTPAPLEPAIEKALQRVAQGALFNVVRHAKATLVLVNVRYSEHHVDLVIQDDGNGAAASILDDYTKNTTHFGLRSMQRQIEELGGEFTVSNGDENGLVVRARVPARPR
jgi:signal transduction histidine kinase